MSNRYAFVTACESTLEAIAIEPALAAQLVNAGNDFAFAEQTKPGIAEHMFDSGDGQFLPFAPDVKEIALNTAVLKAHQVDLEWQFCRFLHGDTSVSSTDGSYVYTLTYPATIARLTNILDSLPPAWAFAAMRPIELQQQGLLDSRRLESSNPEQLASDIELFFTACQQLLAELAARPCGVVGWVE